MILWRHSSSCRRPRRRPRLRLNRSYSRHRRQRRRTYILTMSRNQNMKKMNEVNNNQKIEEETVILCHPFPVIISGTTHCEKNCLTQRLLNIVNFLCKPFFYQIVWLYKMWQPLICYSKLVCLVSSLYKEYQLILIRIIFLTRTSTI